jgi:hypothetical protein
LELDPKVEGALVSSILVRRGSGPVRGLIFSAANSIGQPGPAPVVGLQTHRVLGGPGQGFTAASIVLVGPCLDDGSGKLWKPKTSRGFSSANPLRTALVKSRNWSHPHRQRIGMKAIIDRAKAMGRRIMEPNRSWPGFGTFTP